MAIVDPAPPVDPSLTDEDGGRAMEREGLAAFIDRHGDRAAEILWAAALAMLERAADEARSSSYIGRRGWWSDPTYAIDELREHVDRALELAELAIAVQQDENERHAAIKREGVAAMEFALRLEAGRRRTA